MIKLLESDHFAGLHSIFSLPLHAEMPSSYTGPNALSTPSPGSQYLMVWGCILTLTHVGVTVVEEPSCGFDGACWSSFVALMSFNSAR